MFQWKQVVGNTLCVTALLGSTATFASNPLGLESAEHVSAGEKIKLFFDAHDAGKINYPLHLSNGLTLTYAQMIALSGDFYGVPEKTISEANSSNDRKARFIEAYNTLALDPAAVSEVPRIYAVIQREQEALVSGISHGEKPEDIYTRIGDDNNRQWNCITGGGCASMWWLTQGRYLNLAKRDFDHFGENAWLAYQAGHTVAIETAIAAHQTGDLQKLETAYAMDAYASHFLSDRFAAGHMRTPRSNLPASVTPEVLGSILATFMHKEENNYGLHVHNLRGDHWYATGDRYYFDSRNNVNRIMLQETLQESVNEIFYAYQNGTVPVDHVSELIPQPDEIGAMTQQDISPLFYWDDSSHALYRRSDVASVNDNHWTSDWWGWTTLIMLAQTHGLPVESQRELVASGYGNEAMKYGLIKDKTLTTYLKKSN